MMRPRTTFRRGMGTMSLQRLMVFLVAFLSVAPVSAQQEKKPQEVKIGVYLKNIERVDILSNSYYLDFILWMRWKGPIDPTKSLHFVNVIDRSGMTVNRATEEPELL